MTKNEKLELFAQRLSDLRKKRGMTSITFAEKLGIARSTYAGYEAAYRHPSLETMYDMAKLLKTSTDYLMGVTDNPYPKDPPTDVKEFLEQNMAKLTYDGVPLTEEELAPIKQLLSIVVRDRVPKLKEGKFYNEKSVQDKTILDAISQKGNHKENTEGCPETGTIN